MSPERRKKNKEQVKRNVTKLGALNFTETLHDSKTVPQALEQYQRLMDKEPKKNSWIEDIEGQKKIGNTELHTPKPKKNITATKRKRFKRRAAIEPVIGHLKHDYRMIRNYLKGTTGDAINVMLAAAAMNFKRIMNKWRDNIFLLLDFIFDFLKIELATRRRKSNYCLKVGF